MTKLSMITQFVDTQHDNPQHDDTQFNIVSFSIIDLNITSLNAYGGCCYENLLYYVSLFDKRLECNTQLKQGILNGEVSLYH